MSANCCAGPRPRMILACSGGSNVGQLANQAAVELTREGDGALFCLAGLGGGLPGLIEAARAAAQAEGGVLAIDGCELACARATMERAGVPVGEHLVVTALGLPKVKDRQLALPREDVERVKAAARQGRG